MIDSIAQQKADNSRRFVHLLQNCGGVGVSCSVAINLAERVGPKNLHML
jgi:hypothetical protein